MKRTKNAGLPLATWLATLCLLTLGSSCAGEVEDEGERQTLPALGQGGECTVEFRGGVCSFVCSDCDVPADCDNAVGTAVDECLFESRQ